MSDHRQFCTFLLDGLYFGVEVKKVQEVIRYQEMTRVPLAPIACTDTPCTSRTSRSAPTQNASRVQWPGGRRMRRRARAARAARSPPARSTRWRRNPDMTG